LPLPDLLIRTLAAGNGPPVRHLALVSWPRQRLLSGCRIDRKGLPAMSFDNTVTTNSTDVTSTHLSYF